MWLIPLTKGKFACVDDCDIERLSRHSWYAMQPKRERYPHKWYAATRTEKRIVLMHRMITDAPPASHVDHQDNDGLHNRRGNLRVCTPSQNSGNRGPSRCNKLGLKGIARMGKRFVAYYHPNRKKVHLGCFGTAEEAARAYDAAARQYYGEFAKTNFPVNA